MWIVGFGHLGYTSVVLGDPGVIPCDSPMVRHPGSKGTEIFHARNFRVQPQAIMGSSIVE